MPQIAGFRGVVQQDPSKAGAIDIAKGLATGALTRDPSRAVYRYHQTFAGPGGRSLVRKSLVCALRLTPWAEGMVRRHEAAPAADRDAALAAIRTHGAHTEPVLAGFRDQPLEVDRLLRRTETGRPTFELTSNDGVTHHVWRVHDAELLGKLRHYFAPKKLHVLDGHARYEAMLAYQEELAAKQPLAMYSSANYGLAYLVNLDDPVLAAAPRHRIVRGTGIAPGVVLAGAATHFIVEKLAGAAADLGAQQAALGDALAHQPVFVAVFAGDRDAWKLTLKPDVSPVVEGVATDRAVQKVDAISIQHLFLDRLVAGGHVTTDTNAGGALGALASGAELVLIVRPISVAQIVQVAEVGAVLPPGSTAFHPAIASGIISLVIDPDDDLV